jgi:hypothetical protein
MAIISDQRLSKPWLPWWTKMTITGRINWQLPEEKGLNGGILVIHFFSDVPGPDPKRHAIGVWVSRGPRSRLETKEFEFRADTKGGTETEFRIKLRKFHIERDDGGHGPNENRGTEKVYARLLLENISAEPRLLTSDVHTNSVLTRF